MAERIVLIGPTAERYKGGIAQMTSAIADELSTRSELSFFSWYQLYPYFLSSRDFVDRVSSARLSKTEAQAVLGFTNPMSWQQVVREICQRAPSRLILVWSHPVHAPVYWWILRALRRRWRGEVVLICHNVAPHEAFPGAAWLTKAIVRRVDRIVVHGSSEATRARELFGDVAVTKLFLPTFTVLDTDTDAATTVGEPASERSLLFFGIIRDYKGLDVLLRALPIVRQHYPDVRLTIAGEEFGAKQDSTSPLQLVEQLGLQDIVDADIRYIPNEDVGPIFSSAALAVFPYRSATQSGAIATAYAFGVPVVATRVGSIPDAVEEGVSGYLVTSDDPQAIADGIMRYFENPIPRAQVFEFARRFTWERYVDGLLA